MHKIWRRVTTKQNHALPKEIEILKTNKNLIWLPKTKPKISGEEAKTEKQNEARLKPCYFSSENPACSHKK